MKSSYFILATLLILLTISNVYAAEEQQQSQGTRFRHLESIRGGKIAWIVIAAVGAIAMITVFIVNVVKFWFKYVPGQFTPGYVAQKV